MFEGGGREPLLSGPLTQIDYRKVSVMKMYVGTSGYSYQEWKGRFYPDKMPPGEMLRFYAGRFKTRSRSTIYRMPTESVLTAWAAQVSEDFRTVKAPQVVTHFKRLKGVDEEAAYLFRTLTVFKDRLGPVLFQFPKSFKADRGVLEDFLALVPGTVSSAFEFRHPSWLEGGIPDLLRANGCSLCLSDTDEAPVTELISTAGVGVSAPAPRGLHGRRPVTVAGEDQGAAMADGVRFLQTRRPGQGTGAGGALWGVKEPRSTRLIPRGSCTGWKACATLFLTMANYPG